MVELVTTQHLEDDEITVQLTPCNGFFIIQITSPMLRGTLVVDDQTDREEMTTLASGISDLLEQQLQHPLDPNELPQ